MWPSLIPSIHPSILPSTHSYCKEHPRIRSSSVTSPSTTPQATLSWILYTVAVLSLLRAHHVHMCPRGRALSSRLCSWAVSVLLCGRGSFLVPAVQDPAAQVTSLPSARLWVGSWAVFRSFPLRMGLVWAALLGSPDGCAGIHPGVKLLGVRADQCSTWWDDAKLVSKAGPNHSLIHILSNIWMVGL